eukprot:Tamp_04754.p1 GENE.Tamp_04754~~Tamp_04754.p1  ORF type:complete len:431 (+),score=169.90 Tamp_04754:157-1293(+)
MGGEFGSDLVAQFKANGGVIERNGITVKLAEYYGFCWGAERAVAMAMEARTFYPDDNMHITNEILHNPEVNNRLAEMNINFVPQEGGKTGAKDWSNIKDGDVVILPAFGASLSEMQLLEQKNARIVDTTCPWVSKVWNAVDSHRRKDMTTILHGKYKHEEAIATASMADTYLMVLNMDEAKYVTNYILNGGDKTEFMEKFKYATSADFDPDVHLKKIGIANQTTMYKEETAAIAKLFERAMLKKMGPEKLNDHFMALDTICDATQERQDAVADLLKDDSIDMFLVVGGWDSSNTAHLLELVELSGKTGYHIALANNIKEDGSVEHRLMDGSIATTKDFLKGVKTIGLTSGASTPDKFMENALERVFMLQALKQDLAAA